MFGFSLASAIAIGFCLDLKSQRQRLFRYDLPVTIGLGTHFPYTAAKAVKITIMIIMVGKPYDDIYSPARIENKLHAVHVFAAIAMSWSVCRRPFAF